MVELDRNYCIKDSSTIELFLVVILTDCRDMCRQRGSCVFVLNLLGGLTANLFGLVAASESTQLGKKLSP